MKISVLCSSISHPVFSLLRLWCDEMSKKGHDVELQSKSSCLNGGDVLFLISCTEVIKPEVRQNYKRSLVIHASNLPQGRGWSPHVWEILKGVSKITLTLLEAADAVDSGDIWKKTEVEILPTDLYDEINGKIFAAELELMNYAITNFNTINPKPQDGLPSYYMKRKPEDSEINVDMSIRSQFNLIRVCDPNRYPAYFYLGGVKYILNIKKADK